jgi:hypothetical protein
MAEDRTGGLLFCAGAIRRPLAVFIDPRTMFV